MAPEGQPDADWAELQAGRITERDYWDQRAAEWATLGGHDESVRAMIAHLYDPPRPAMVRAGAHALIRDAKLAGHRIGVLTNDLKAFHSDEWIEQMHVARATWTCWSTGRSRAISSRTRDSTS